MTGKTILIVEDEAVTAMELEETLSRRGYSIIGVATTGTAAIRIAKEKWPDVILMDIHIQGPIDGIEAADRINLFYEIPIIFLTAYSDDLTMSRAIKSRSYSFLLKPFNEKELFSNIEMAINRHRLYEKSMAVQRIVTSLFDLVTDSIIATDPDGNVRRVNATFESLTGLNRDDLNGKKFWDVVPVECEYRDQLEGLIAHARENGDQIVHWPYFVTLRLHDGSVQQMSLNIELLMLANRTLLEMMYILTPIKEERKSSV
ncbi:MAG: response regulator [Methanoregula sp.]